MPILDVEIVGDPSPSSTGRLSGAVAEMAGEVLGSRPGGTWVKLRFLPPEQYAENGPPPTPGELPVFATILHREPPVGPALEREIAALTEGLARVLARAPDRVHLQYLPAAAGRQSFGGRLVG
jgi:hypothetical protein